MIKDLIFLLKQNKVFFSNNKGNQMLLWIMIIVVLILVGTLFVAQQNGLFNNNVDSLVDYTGGLFGSTND